MGALLWVMTSKINTYREMNYRYVLLHVRIHMYICTYVCVYIYIYIYVYTYIYIYVYICVVHRCRETYYR